MDSGYKNIVGSRKNVLIRCKIGGGGAYRNVSSENVLISGVLITGFYCMAPQLFHPDKL